VKIISPEERLLAQFEYKIAEHARAAADHNLQIETLRQMKGFVERTIEDVARANAIIATQSDAAVKHA